MVVRHTIGTYKVLLLDRETGGTGPHAGFVFFYAPSGAYLGYLCGVRDGAPIPSDSLHPNGILHIHLPQCEMMALVETLRTERAWRLKYDTIEQRGLVELIVTPQASPVGVAQPPGRCQTARSQRSSHQGVLSSHPFDTAAE